MIIEVFVPQGQAEDTLSQQLFEAVLDSAWIAGIHEAIGETVKDTELSVELMKNQDTGIATEVLSVEIGRQDLTSRTLQLDAIGFTVCLQGLHLFVIRK